MCVEVPRTCQPQWAGRLSPLELGCPQPPLSSATHHPKNIPPPQARDCPDLGFILPLLANRGDPCFPQMQTSREAEAWGSSGTDTLTCSGADRQRSTRPGDRMDAPSAAGWPCLLLKDRAAAARGRCQLKLDPAP